MQLTLGPDDYVVLDLDDTLYAEVDFVRSGFRAVAAHLEPVVGTNLFAPMWQLYLEGANAFAWATGQAARVGSDVDLAELLRCYREHSPQITLGPGVRRFLDLAKACGSGIGVVTDGRSLTQRNKIDALGLSDLLDDVVISEELGSEKPDPRNFAVFTDAHPLKRFVFFGDNTTKDFVVPAALGWTTVCVLDSGRHIHPQHADPDPRPDHLIRCFDEVDVIGRATSRARH